MLASIGTLLSHGYVSFSRAIKSLKLLTDPSFEGDPYEVGHPSEERLELKLKMQTSRLGRRRMMFRI